MGATRAWVLHPDLTHVSRARAAETSLQEALSLALALPGLEVLGGEVVRLPKAHPGTLFGSGKIEALHDQFEADEVDLVFIDGAVSPVQQRNLEKAWGLKLLDRTGLILEIFGDRARTREGVLQVEMAALSYQRTRLVRAWTHLERQRGGLGFVGGPGETQIEADRRAIDEQLGRLKKQLSKVVKTRALHRSARRKVPYPIVALVGYTNAGKSTLFNRLTGAEVLAQDMLFATLDPTMRAVTLPSGPEVILSDTVGFISDLPTQLVAAFRATLEEVLEADLILHVRDISDPDSDAQAEDVGRILGELGVSDATPQFEVWNKLDLVQEDRQEVLETLAARQDTVFLTSAMTGEGLDPLLEAVATSLAGRVVTQELRLAYAQGRARAWLHEQGVIAEERQDEEGYALSVRWTPRQAAQFERLL